MVEIITKKEQIPENMGKVVIFNDRIIFEKDFMRYGIGHIYPLGGHCAVQAFLSDQFRKAVDKTFQNNGYMHPGLSKSTDLDNSTCDLRYVIVPEIIDIEEAMKVAIGLERHLKNKL